MLISCGILSFGKLYTGGDFCGITSLSTPCPLSTDRVTQTKTGACVLLPRKAWAPRLPNEPKVTRKVLRATAADARRRTARIKWNIAQLRPNRRWHHFYGTSWACQDREKLSKRMPRFYGYCGVCGDGIRQQELASFAKSKARWKNNWRKRKDFKGEVSFFLIQQISNQVIWYFIFRRSPTPSIVLVPSSVEESYLSTPWCRGSKPSVIHSTHIQTGEFSFSL